MIANNDAATDALERRWFAAQRAYLEIRAECDAIRRSVETQQAAWRRALEQQCELEAIRNSLGEQLAQIDLCRENAVRIHQRRVMSIA